MPAFAVAALLAACSSTPEEGGPASPGPSGTGATAEQTIDSAGGVVELEGARLEVPPGAVAANVTIVVTSQPTPAPERFRAATPVFRFEPAGTTFALPVTITFTVADAPGELRVFWSSRHAFEFCGNTVQSVSSDGTNTRQLAGTFSVSGTSLSFSAGCPAGVTTSQSYTATSTALFLWEDLGEVDGVHEYHVSEYHRQ